MRRVGGSERKTLVSAASLTKPTLSEGSSTSRFKSSVKLFLGDIDSFSKELKLLQTVQFF
jgi:hypothetical protein